MDSVEEEISEVVSLGPPESGGVASIWPAAVEWHLHPSSSPTAKRTCSALERELTATQCSQCGGARTPWMQRYFRSTHGISRRINTALRNARQDGLKWSWRMTWDCRYDPVGGMTERRWCCRRGRGRCSPVVTGNGCVVSQALHLYTYFCGAGLVRLVGGGEGASTRESHYPPKT